jgi:hypothetical protein
MQVDQSVNRPANRFAAIFVLCISGILMVMCESELIWGLWLNSPANGNLGHLFTPVLAAFPFFYALAFRISSKKWVEREAITAPTAESFSFGLSLLALIVYMTIYDLAGMAQSH